MYYVLTILKRDLRSLTSRGGKGDSQKASLWAIQLAAYLAFGVLIGYGAFRLFTYLNTELAGLPGLIDGITVTILAGSGLFAVFVVLVTGLQVIYKTVYESDDIGFLLIQPVPVPAVFMSKFIASYVSLLSIGAGFGIPPWIGWGVANGAGPSFYVYSILGFLLLLLLAHGLVTLLLLVAMKHIQGRKMKQLFIVCSALVGVVFVIITQMFSAKMSQMNNPADMLKEMSASQFARTWYLPSTWMVNAVFSTISRFGLNGTPYALALAGTSLGVAAIALWVSGRWYLTGWAGRNEETGPSKRRISRRTAERRGFLASLRGTYWSVLRKDLSLLVRDPIIWYSMVVSVITLGFFIFSTARTASARSGGAGATMGTLVVMMSALMGSVSSAQTGGISVSREGASFWLLRSNPTDAMGLTWAKMTYALLPQVLVITLALVASHITSVMGLPLWVGFLLGFSTAATLASLQIMLDVLYPDFSMKVEFGSAKSGRGTRKLLVSMFLSMGIAMAWMFIWQIPAMLADNGFLWGLPVATWQWITRGFTVTVGVVMLIVVHTVGVRRIAGLLIDA